MKPKVLMIDIGGWGGITHYTYNLMQALTKQEGADCVLLTDSAYELEFFPCSFRILKAQLKNQSYGAAVSAVIKAIRVERPHVIHVQTMIAARRDWLLFILARLSGLRIVFTAHNVLPHDAVENRAFFMKTAFRIIYGCSHRIIVHSRYSRAKLKILFGVPDSKISVIFHGNYLFMRTRELTREQARDMLGLPHQKKIILHFGALRAYKGIDVLLEAFSLLEQRDPQVLLLLAGKTMNVPQGYVEGLIKKSGVHDDVVFKDFYVPLKDIPAYFFASDIVVLPYKEIDTSGSIQLAYAFSKPVVAANTGSMPEVLEDGKNGVLVEPENAAALAAACECILFDEERAACMGEHSLLLAQQKFGWDRIAEQTAQLYREVYGE